MYQEKLENLVKMSVEAGKRVAYVQAGGGNTSVKFEDGYMAIKASGYLLKEMTESSGFVTVNGKAMEEYHNATYADGADPNKEAMELALSTIKQIHGEKRARPSVEVGFHSILDTYVLHLHPVYVNVLMCSQGGVERALEIARRESLDAVAVPYTMPGYALTRLISGKLEEYRNKTGRAPNVIFLKNHGIITTADTWQEASSLMEKVNDAIRRELPLPAMPAPGIEPWGKGYRSTCSWMTEELKSHPEIVQAIRYEAVYPDQLVYTANEMSVDGSHKKIMVTEEGMVYHAGEKEARALDETMTALFYIYYHIKHLGLSYERLTREECADILGWDSEKYRKSLMTEAFP